MIFEGISAEIMLFLVLYGVTGVVPLIAALYLLLRKGNAIAPGVTPPMRLRCWTASFFAVSALAHVWWLLFFIYSGNLDSVTYLNSVSCLLLAMLDCVLLFTTFVGMLLAMLQDRHRPVWPPLVAMIPFVALCLSYMVYPTTLILQIASIYLLALSFLFAGHMVFAIRQYRRWLNDNFADLENKKVWLCQVVALVSMLLFVLYILASNMVLIWVIHVVELMLVGLLLWRVETLPKLDALLQPLPVSEGSGQNQAMTQVQEQSTPLPYRDGQGGGASVTIDLVKIEQLLSEHCVATQLYLRHDLTLQQLAQAIGTNRYYLSQYFTRQSITYNTYINNLRINHFISRYQEIAAAGQPVVAQQLASESGYRSYSTFSLAFKQRTGQSVTAWMKND